MVFIFRPLKIYPNIQCLCTSKLLFVKYGSNAKEKLRKAAVSSVREPPYQMVSNSRRTRLVATDSSPPGCQVISHPNANIITKDTSFDTRKDSRLLEKSEWKHMEVDSKKLYKHCLMLSKIRLTSLVVITTMAGYALAPGPFNLYAFTMCSLGTGLVSAAANAINQFFEVPFDAQMSRTKNRVLVRGHLTPAHAITFATISGIVGLSILYSEVNGVTTVLAGTNLTLYTLIYTPMKRVSILNTWVGSVVGAIPPLMGWAGCVGDVTAPGAWIMSGLLYAWQFPHFNALSWNLRPDYSRAGYRMMAVTDPDLCRKTALRYTMALSGLCYVAPTLGVTNWWFAIISTPLNGYFLYLAWQFYRRSDSGSSRKLFRFSLIHLPALMVLMLFNKKDWFINENQPDSIVVHKEKQQEASVFTTFKKLVASTVSASA